MSNKIIILLCVFINLNLIIAQDKVDSTYVKFTNQKIKIDGIDNEADWADAEIKSGFWQWFPTDSIKALKQTEIKFLYDSNNIYAFIKCYEKKNESIISSLRRDMGRFSDFFLFTLDTFNDLTNGYAFGGNSVGVKKDEILFNGGRTLGQDSNWDWDAKFDLETQIYENFYTAEMRIPFSSIRFANNSKFWSYNVSRRRIIENEFSTLFKVPQEQSFINLSYTKPLVFEKPLGKSKTPIIVIPYINLLKSKKFDIDERVNNLEYGGDGRIIIGTGLNLDFTANPDFSQIEVDDQIINLTRFAVALPEKRQFFIQNNDLFSGFGDFYENQPFFTRRIGVAKDLNGNTIQNKIRAGVRLSGKLTNRLRVGLLNMQTARDEVNLIPSNNNTVLSFQQNIFSKSNLKFLLVNRQKTGENNFESEQERYNRLLGLDYNFISKNDKIRGKVFFYNTFSPSENKEGLSTGLRLNYNDRKNRLRTVFTRTTPNFISDLGFSRRTGFKKNYTKYDRVFFPKSESIQSIQIGPEVYYVDKPHINNLVTDLRLSGNLSFNFKNMSGIDLVFTNNYIYLENDFDPTGANENTPIISGEYDTRQFEIEYGSTNRRKFRFNSKINIGGYFNGEKYSLSNNFNFRVDKLMQASLKFSYDKIDLPSPQYSVNLFLISPRVDFTFSKNIFWATFIQYSNFSDSLGINSRFQWRFAPLSDLFLVYTDNSNYFDSDFIPNFRTINLKITYWINI
ncbi:MAG: hydrolase [Flavobacteriaceae bacterium]|nr:hydrolase [Flavobacteriaceae bacterium]